MVNAIPHQIKASTPSRAVRRDTAKLPDMNPIEGMKNHRPYSAEVCSSIVTTTCEEAEERRRTETRAQRVAEEARIRRKRPNVGAEMTRRVRHKRGVARFRQLQHRPGEYRETHDRGEGEDCFRTACRGCRRSATRPWASAPRPRSRARSLRLP